MSEQVPEARLEADGLIRRDGPRYRTTRRWQAALARAAHQLVYAGEARDDLRVPVALALLELYGPDEADEDLASMVEVMLPVEVAELAPPGP